MTRTPPNYARPCRRKLHTIPAGVMGCLECNKMTNRAPRRKSPGSSRKGIIQPPRLPRLLGSIPPDAVLDGAACSPPLAYLFDPIEERGRLTVPQRDRIAQAKAICQRCLVLEACLADAIENRRVGTWGGTYLSAKWYEKSRKNNAA